MPGPSPILGGLWTVGGSSSPPSGYDVVWVDLRFPVGGNTGRDSAPFSTANTGLGALLDGGTLVMAGGDASGEPGVTIGAKNATFIGFSGQKGSGGVTPILPTLTYAITTGTQKLAFRNISVALVHSGTAASLTDLVFEFCPTVTITAGSDAPAITWTGAPSNTISGSGGAAQFVGGTIAGYVANSGNVGAWGSNVTSDITSSGTITLVGTCTFGGPVSITAPTIILDAATKKNAATAGVTFSSTPTTLAVFGTPSDVGTANAQGSSTDFAAKDHVHNLPFSAVLAALALANATINVNGQKITGLATPTSSTDAVTKAYADAAAQGLKVKSPAVAVATANQATLSGTAQTIDGVALNTIGMRVLLTAQSTATQNGLWTVQSGAWTRPADFATGSSAAQSYVLVTGGTLGAGSAYYCTNAAGSDVVDTANLTFVLFTQPATITAGNGLQKVGTTLSAVAADGTISVSGSGIAVGTVGNANLSDNTIALSRLVNAGAQGDFLARNSSGAGAWQDVTTAQAKSLLGIFASGMLQTVRAATTTNITLSGTQTVDGVALVANDRCLVKNQSTASQNGVYLVQSGAWTRAVDASSGSQLFAGVCVPIGPEGTTNAKRVAMLTTADPITVGTTALTFAMDRIVPVTSTAPLDVTNGAAQVGTGIDAARVDHVHSIGFAVVAAVLAVASSSISVNSQKITSLATPTVSTDAATKGYVDTAISTAIGGTTAPANPGDNNKVAYANAGALAYASQIKTDGTYISTGTNPAASGTFRISYNTFWEGKGDGTIVTGDVQLFKWGLSGGGIDNSMIWGSPVSTAAIINNVATGGSYFWNWNGTGFVSFNANSGLSITQQAATSGTAPVVLNIIGAAHTGLTASTEPRDITINLARTVTLSAGAIASARAVRFQAPTYAFAGASTVTTAATVAIAAPPNAGTNATFTNALSLWIETGSVGYGTTPAQSGTGRYTGNTALKWRNSAGTPNTLDINGLSVDSTDTVNLGDSTNATAVTVGAKSGGSVTVTVGATNYVFAGGLDVASKKITSLATGTASTDAANVGQLTSVSLAGDVTGTVGANTVGKIQGAPVTAIGAANTVLGTTDGVNITYFQLVDAQVSSSAAIAVSKLANGSALSVLGRSANSSGAHADIAGSNNTVLLITGSTLAFGQVDLSTAQVTGVLPTGNQATQSMGGDVTGTTAVSTVVKLQNRALSSSAPSDGYPIVWNAGTSTWVTNGYILAITPPAVSSGTAPLALSITAAAHTGLTASTEASDVFWNLNRTVTMATGDVTSLRAVKIDAPTYAFVGASNVGEAVTLRIAGAPTAGAHATFTNKAAVRITSDGIAFSNPPGSPTAIAWSSIGALKFPINPGTFVGYIAHDAATSKAALAASGDGSTFTDLSLGDQDATTGNRKLNLLAKTQAIVSIAATAILTLSSTAMTVAPAAATSGTAPVVLSITGAAHTGLTASTEPRDVTFALNRTVTMATGALTNARAIRFQAPTYAFAGASTITNASTLAISGAPIAGTNATITNPYALLIEAGGIGFGPASSNALLNFANNVTIASGLDSGGTTRNLLGWTSASHLTVGSGNISVDVVAQGNTWAFGATFAAPGVAHTFATGAHLDFGATPATLSLLNVTYAGVGVSILATKDSGGTDQQLLGYSGTTNHLQLGNGTIGTDIYGSAGLWSFGASASFPGVEHAFAANAFLTLGNVASAPSAPGSGGRVYEDGGAIKHISSNGVVTTMAPA